MGLKLFFFNMVFLIWLNFHWFYLICYPIHWFWIPKHCYGIGMDGTNSGKMEKERFKYFLNPGKFINSRNNIVKNKFYTDMCNTNFMLKFCLIYFTCNSFLLFNYLIPEEVSSIYQLSITYCLLFGTSFLFRNVNFPNMWTYKSLSFKV